MAKHRARVTARCMAWAGRKAPVGGRRGACRVGEGEKWSPSPSGGWGVGSALACESLLLQKRFPSSPKELSWKNIPGQERKTCLSWSYLKMYLKGPVTWMGWPGLTLQSPNTGHVTQLRVTGSNYS